MYTAPHAGYSDNDSVESLIITLRKFNLLPCLKCPSGYAGLYGTDVVGYLNASSKLTDFSTRRPNDCTFSFSISTALAFHFRFLISLCKFSFVIGKNILLVFFIKQLFTNSKNFLFPIFGDPSRPFTILTSASTPVVNTFHRSITK